MKKRYIIRKTHEIMPSKEYLDFPKANSVDLFNYTLKNGLKIVFSSISSLVGFLSLKHRVRLLFLLVKMLVNSSAEMETIWHILGLGISKLTQCITYILFDKLQIVVLTAHEVSVSLTRTDAKFFFFSFYWGSFVLCS